MSVNALRLLMVFSLMVMPQLVLAVDPLQQPGNMNQAGRDEEAAETQRLIDYYKSQGMTGAIDAGGAYRTNSGITRTNLKDVPAYNTDYIRRANQENAVNTEYTQDNSSSPYSVSEGAGVCFKRSGNSTVPTPCNDGQNRGGATVDLGPSDYVQSNYLDTSKAGPANTNIAPNQRDNPQNRPTLSLKTNP